MAVRKYQMASFGAPSGVTYIANILLEMGIYTYNTFGGHWYNRDRGELCQDMHQFQIFKEVMPFFSRDEFSPFEPNLEVAWSHQWPFTGYLSFPIILWYRNPKGALYSQFKRVTPNQSKASLDKFLRTGYYYLGLSPIDEWAIYHLLWLALIPKDRIHTTSFDRTKFDSENELMPLLNFLRVQKETGEILRAVGESSVEKALTAQSLASNNQGIIRKGDPNEYREVYSPDQLLPFDELSSYVLDILNGDDVFDAEKIDIESAVDRICTYSGSKIPDDILTSLLNDDLFEVDHKLPSVVQNNIAASVLELALHYTCRLLSSTINPYNDFSFNQTIVAAKVILYGLSCSSHNPLVIKRASQRQKDKRGRRKIKSRIKSSFSRFRHAFA